MEAEVTDNSFDYLFQIKSHSDDRTKILIMKLSRIAENPNTPTPTPVLLRFTKNFERFDMQETIGPKQMCNAALTKDGQYMACVALEQQKTDDQRQMTLTLYDTKDSKIIDTKDLSSVADGNPIGLNEAPENREAECLYWTESQIFINHPSKYIVHAYTPEE